MPRWPRKRTPSVYLNCAYATPEGAEGLRIAAAAAGKNLDIGKSCIRFKRLDQLPLDLIRDEIASTTPEQFVAITEKARARS